MLSDYPYTYDDLLHRLYQTYDMHETNQKISLPPLNVTKINRMSAIGNFSIIAEKINRSPDQIREFFRTETGVNNSINSQGQLLIQGILNETKCESIMRNYIKEHVLCKQCKSLHTQLLKKDGLIYLECRQCLAKTSMGKKTI